MTEQGEHVFLKSQRIEEADIREVLALSTTGQLEWGKAGGNLAAVGTNVEYSMSPEYSLHHNLIEVRVGYMPTQNNAFNYLRMSDFKNEQFYVEHDTDDPLATLAGRVLRVGLIAVNVRNGRLSGSMEKCSGCREYTGHLKLYKAAHGIPGAVMSGSEHSECTVCGHTEH